MNLLDGQTNDQNLDPNKDYLSELIGPNGKFHDTDEKQALQKLARGKVESDSYIKTLESQLDTMRQDALTWRDEANARASLQELVEKLSNAREGNHSDVNLNANDNQQTPPSLDPKTIEELVAKKMTEAETNRQQEANHRTVFNKVKEVLGENFASTLRRQATELNLTDDEVNSLARSNPKLFFRTFGIESNEGNNNFQAPPRGMRTDHFAPANHKRTWAYYQELRKSNPKLYYDKKTTVQMHQDAQDLGEAFKDGDWYASN